MNNQNYQIEALEIVLGWDLPDDLIPLALNEQVNLMAGFDYEAGWGRGSDSPDNYH